MAAAKAVVVVVDLAVVRVAVAAVKPVPRGEGVTHAITHRLDVCLGIGRNHADHQSGVGATRR